MPRTRHCSHPLIGLLFGIAFVAVAAFLGRARPSAAAGRGLVPTPSVVEEVRYTRAGEYLVQHRILVDTSVVSDPAAVADQVAGVTADAGGVDAGGVSAQYVVNAWKWPESAMPVKVSYNPSLQAPRPSLAAPIQNAVDQWSSVTPATFQFVYAGTTSATTGACDGAGVPDGINTIAYVTTLQKGILGQTCTLTMTDSSTGDVTLFEFDMQLNWTIDWGGQTTQPGQYDIFSTILHEMGHAAGLAHPCFLNSPACTATDIASVMYPSLKLGVEKRSLTQDDMDGLRAQYPGGPTPLPTVPPFNRLFDIRVAAVSHD